MHIIYTIIYVLLILLLQYITYCHYIGIVIRICESKRMKNNNIFAHPNTPTATAASRITRSWSMSARFSGRMVAVFLG